MESIHKHKEESAHTKATADRAMIAKSKADKGKERLAKKKAALPA